MSENLIPFPSEEYQRKHPGWDNPFGFRALAPAGCEGTALRPYVIKGLIGQGDVAILSGQPGAGKSILAPHLAYAVAQGRQVFGRRVKQRRVIYIAAEDGYGMTQRIRALYRRHANAPDFRLIPDALDLFNPGGRDRDGLRRFVDEFQPGLIVIDTLARAFPGLRENDAEDMGRVVAYLRELAGICGSAVIAVHHVAKDGGSTPRGHGCLNGDADVTLLIEGTGADLRTVRMGKNRNGPSDASFAFNVAAADLGTDEDGDPITAPIAEEAEQTRADRMKPREAKLPDRAAVLLREAREAIAKHGTDEVPMPGMPPVPAIPRAELRARLIEAGWFPENLLRTASQLRGASQEARSSESPDSEHLLRDASQGARSRMELERAGYATENHGLTALKRRGFLSFNRDWVWLP